MAEKEIENQNARAKASDSANIIGQMEHERHVQHLAVLLQNESSKMSKLEQDVTKAECGAKTTASHLEAAIRSESQTAAVTGLRNAAAEAAVAAAAQQSAEATHRASERLSEVEHKMSVNLNEELQA